LLDFSCLKERLAAEKAAKEAEEKGRAAKEEQERVVREEEERVKRLEQLEAIRKQEEEDLERRRRELMADENGYWAIRMAEEQQRAALAMAIGATGSAVADGDSDAPARSLDTTSLKSDDAIAQPSGGGGSSMADEEGDRGQ